MAPARPRPKRAGSARARPGRLDVGDPHARIHIAPVGFEVERVTDPALAEGADRVYLITRPADDAARPFVDEVVRRLTRGPRPVEVLVRHADLWDVFGALGALRAIFEREHRIDRRAPDVVPIRVNVSTGTKITAIAGTLACMLWKGEPYYAQVSRSWYTGLTPEVRPVNDVVRRVDPVAVYELRSPSPELVEVLAALARRGGALRKRELLRELGLDALRDANGRPLSPQAQHSRLRSRLEPLEHRWGFVRTRRAGARGTVELAPQGRLALGLFQGLGSERSAPGSRD